MNKRIVLINQSTGPLFIDMCNAYLNKYSEVILITGKIMPTYAELDPKVNIVLKKKLNGLRSSNQIYTWIVFFLQSLFYIMFTAKIDKILFVSNPPILPFLGYFFSRFKKFEYDVLVYDIYPDALLSVGYCTEKSLVYKIWEHLNRKTYQHATRIFTISEFMKNIISRTSCKRQVEVVYPWVDNSFIKPKNKSDNWFVKHHKLESKKVILYSGNMGLTHDLMTVLHAAKLLRDEKDALYHFMFIGDGNQLRKLKKYKIDNSLENVSFLPFQKAAVLPYSFASADYGIVTLGAGAEGLSVPSKMFYFLAAGCSIIAISNKGSEIEHLVNENKLGATIEPEKSYDLVSFLRTRNDAELSQAKINSRNLSERFTVENATNFL